MDQMPRIHKKALIAIINDVRKRAVVDTFYKVVNEKQKLILVYADGSQEIFKGLRAA